MGQRQSVGAGMEEDKENAPVIGDEGLKSSFQQWADNSSSSLRKTHLQTSFQHWSQNTAENLQEPGLKSSFATWADTTSKNLQNSLAQESFVRLAEGLKGSTEVKQSAFQQWAQTVEPQPQGELKQAFSAWSSAVEEDKVDEEVGRLRSAFSQWAGPGAKDGDGSTVVKSAFDLWATKKADELADPELKVAFSQWAVGVQEKQQKVRTAFEQWVESSASQDLSSAALQESFAAWVDSTKDTIDDSPMKQSFHEWAQSTASVLAKTNLQTRLEQA